MALANDHQIHQVELRRKMREIRVEHPGKKLSRKDYAESLKITGKPGLGNIDEILQEPEFAATQI